ncbi:MAG TPA: hypothetical protein VFX12_12970 [Vicinamibacterales bacterium]|nr:hypothetical protein [Vicinamibacterales bacterium]
MSSGTGAAAEGVTLKVTAPEALSPTGGVQPDSLVLTAKPANTEFASFPVSYQFQIRSGDTVVYDSNVVSATTSGGNVQFTPAAALTADATYTWRARGAYSGAFGPWSADATFKAPVGGFIRGNELYDPLNTGRSVGQIVGPYQFTSDGLKLLGHESHVTYHLPVTLTGGQFSMLIKGADEGAEGDKSKVFSMQQGSDDITTNDYRFTAELRGSDYPTPGAVTCRMIAGDGVSRDCDRIVESFDSSRWYFWKVSWNVGGSFTLEVRRDGEDGPLVYSNTKGLGGRTYAPNPHTLYLGAPIGRAGPLDATLPGGTYAYVYAGPNQRPPTPK